jgi:hypothetical protein
LNEDDDLYLAGLDSLRAIEITKALKSELLKYRNEDELSWLNTSVLYNHSSISTLSCALSEDIESGNLNTETNIEAEMAALVEKYTQGLKLRVDPHSSGGAAGNTKDLVVALVGSSGYLGTTLLTNSLMIRKSQRFTA